MAGLIARQPNVLLCRYSTVVDDITDYNMTEEDYIESCVERARIQAKETIEGYLQPFDRIEQKLESYMTEEKREQLLQAMSQPVKQ